MEKDIQKLPAKTPTGMIKRSNPLSLGANTTSPNAKLVNKKTVTVNSKKPSVTLSGPKAFMFFIPMINRKLLQAIKAAYPQAKLSELVEKALLQLLKDERPNAYDELFKSGK